MLFLSTLNEGQLDQKVLNKCLLRLGSYYTVGHVARKRGERKRDSLLAQHPAYSRRTILRTAKGDNSTH